MLKKNIKLPHKNMTYNSNNKNNVNLYNVKETVLIHYISRGDTLYNYNLFSEAFNYYIVVINTFKDNYSRINKGDIYNKLAKCKLKTLCYEEALLYLCKCYDYYKNDEDSEASLPHLFNLALTYKKLNNLDRSTKYIDILLNKLDSKKDSEKYFMTITLKANCYIEKGLYDKALFIYTSYLNFFKHKNQKIPGYIYNNLGMLYLFIEDTENSLYAFNESIKIRRNFDIKNLAHCLIDKSKVYIFMKNYSEAIKLLKEGLSLARKYNDNEYILEAYNTLENVYRLIGDYNNMESIYLDLLKELNDIDKCTLLDAYMNFSKVTYSNVSYKSCNELVFNQKK